MKIDGIRTLAGPNIYNHKPVLLMSLRLEELTDKESHEIPGFVERLLALLPGLHQHHCAKGQPGGFIERLHDGTYFGHIVEHVALELTDSAGIPANYGKTVYAGEPGFYHVAVEYRSEHGMRFLLRVAVELVEALVKGEPFPLEEKIKEARRIVAHMELGPSTRSIVEAAERRGIPWMRVDEASMVQLGYSKYRKFIAAAMTSQTSAVAVDIVGDKHLTKTLLEQTSIPVPQGIIVCTEDEAIEALKEIGVPVVVKPLDGRQGKGVSLNLSTPEQVVQAFRIAREYSSSSSVIVEELLHGKNYRVLVVNGRMVAASERLPCHVMGDGSHTISELLEIANQDPLRGEGHEKPLTRIVIDPILLAYLERHGLTLEYIPAEGEMVFLRESANLSTGGTARDVTDEVHPHVARVCERAAQVIGLDICGVDLMLKDISEPIGRGGGIIELNAAPGLRMHHFPSYGQPRDVASSIVEMLYPAGTPSRIPIISITGTNGKTTVTRMIGHILSEANLMVGMTTTDGIYIGQECIVHGDTTGPHSARNILSDPTVEVAVLETARGGIARRGLGYDWSDISVMTNIQPDHIGQDGIETIEDLVHIKSLVAERVRKGGTLILNADDERLARLTENPRVSKLEKKIVYFSLYENHVLIKKHLAAGGTAYFIKDGWLVEAAGQSEHRIVEAAAIPATMSGTARFQIANALSAAAACRAYGIAHEQIAAALSSFRNDLHNPGRANLYQVGGGYVMIDYGHNPDAFEAVCRMASLWHGRRVTGIIGVPGDRDNSIVEQAGRVAARGFNRIIIKEDHDTRGRRKGEIAGLLCEAVSREVPERDCHIVFDECAALLQEVEKITSGDIIVVFYDKLDPVLQVLKQHGAIPVSEIKGLAHQVSAANI